MRITDILSYLKEYIMLGIILIIFLGVTFFIGYKIIYKKLMKGTKTISKGKLLLYGISIVYIVILLGAVFLNRGSLYGNANLHIFSSYLEAYHKMDISLFRNIILNILLFVPLGFLLPIYSDKLKKSYIVILIGLLTTLLIEYLQYITRMGIFEIDDILNNTVGTIIGYSAFMIYYSLKKKEKRKLIFVYVLPIIILISVFLGMFIKYKSKEFGNLPNDYNYKVSMKNVELKSNITLSNEKQNKDIFYKSILTEEETRKIAEDIFKKLDVRIDESRTDIYEETAVYYSENKAGNGYSVWVDYRGGTYSYTDFSNFSKSQDGEKVKEQSNATREEIEEALAKIGIKVPKNSEFKENNDGRYTFLVNMEFENERLIDGNISITYYEDKTVKSIQNNMIEYEKIGEKEVISEEEALHEILKGKFKYDEYNIGRIKDICIENVHLGYVLDTKGYYVPIYIFGANMNGRYTEIYIKAVR